MPTITDLYMQLFGREGTAKGTDIDMSEHGRAGGVSTGAGYKTTRIVEEKTIIDEVDTSTMYIGKALVGTTTSAASWQIKKMTVSGVVTTFNYADGNDEYDNIWDNRTSLSYS